MTRLDRSPRLLVSTLALCFLIGIVLLDVGIAQEAGASDRRVVKGQARVLFRLLGKDESVNLVLSRELPELARVVEVDITGLSPEAGIEKVAAAAGLTVDESNGILRILAPQSAGGRSALAWRVLEAPRAFSHSEARVPALDVTRKLLRDVASDIEGQAQVSLLVDAPLRDAPITLSLAQPVPWRDVVGLVADACNADVEDISANVVRLTMKPRTSLEFRDAPVKDAIRTIARVSGKNLIIPSNLPAVDELITLNVRNVRWDDALDSILKASGLVAFRDPGGIVRITDERDPAWRRMFGDEILDPAATSEPPDAPQPDDKSPAFAEVDRLLARLGEAAEAREFLQTAVLAEQIREQLDRLGAIEDEAVRRRYVEAQRAYEATRKFLIEARSFVGEYIKLHVEEIASGYELAMATNRTRDFRAVVETQADLLSVADTYFGPDVPPAIAEALQRAADLATRAATRLEFKELPLRVAGVSYLADPALRDYSRAVVYYAGVSRELDPIEWPYIEENSDLKLEGITEGGVVFLYKGERIPMGIEEESETPARSPPSRGRRAPGPGRRR